jgi:hypothetical protein
MDTGWDEICDLGLRRRHRSGCDAEARLELQDTGDRREILVHPGHGFLSSVGCINPCTSLPNSAELINYAGSRRRVIDLIENMKALIGKKFPKTNGKAIPGAYVVIDGEPPSE